MHTAWSLGKRLLRPLEFMSEWGDRPRNICARSFPVETSSPSRRALRCLRSHSKSGTARRNPGHWGQVLASSCLALSLETRNRGPGQQWGVYASWACLPS